MASGTSAAAWKPRSKAICCLLAASLAFTAVGVARADMITAEQMANSTPNTDGDPVQASLRRSNVEYQLRSLGVDRKSAEERVAAITDEEIQVLVGKLDALRAGGQYIPPPVGVTGAAGGVGGVIGGYGGGYGGGYTAILVIALVAALNWRSVQNTASSQDYMTSGPAPMDPGRKISVQDCTKPIVLDGGNLRCK